MGETKVSYGLRSMYISSKEIYSLWDNYRKVNRLADVDVYLESLTGKKLIEDENFSKIQDALGNQIGGVFRKGGLGDGLGTMLSKGLWSMNCPRLRGWKPHPVARVDSAYENVFNDLLTIELSD